MRRPRQMIALAALATIVVACSSYERRYRALSAVFDGVPPPGGGPRQLAKDLPPTRNPRTGRTPEGSIHPPFAERQCGDCHVQDGSNQLRAKGQALCWTCHDDEEQIFVGEMIHGPVGAGDCRLCHDPHRAPGLHLLNKPIPDLCLRCHTPATYLGLADHRRLKGDACPTCHAPHAGDRPALLKHRTAPEGGRT